MFRQGLSSKLIILCVAVLLYSVVITVKLLFYGYKCSLQQPPQEELCVEQQKKTVPPLEQQEKTVRPWEQQEKTVPPWEQHLDFDGFDNETGTSDGHFIVPNYVHFIKFGQNNFSFVDAVCVLAAFKNQKPEKLFFHTDAEGFQGKYWDVIMNTTGFKEVLIIRKIKLPTEIFGHRLNKGWKYFHGGDVARMLVLREFGGIYLDRDSYVVRRLDDLRRFEMSIGWRISREMGNQVVVAHKDARFLRLWYESYKNYKRNCFYCNAGAHPSRDILRPNPHLVHRLETLFGNYGIMQAIYTTKFPAWRDYYSIHILSRHLKGLKNLSPTLKYPVVFDEVNVLKYPVAFRDMCKAVYPFPKS